MKNRSAKFAAAAGVAAAFTLTANADLSEGMKKGNPGIQSAGALAFAPEGILFAADPKGAAVFAIATGDTKAGGEGKVDVEKISDKVAALLGTKADDLLIQDMAANPASGAVYLSVSRGRGPDAQAALVRVAPGGELSLVSLDGIAFSKLELSDAPEDKVTGEGRRRGNKRLESITDIAYLDGQLAIAGLSNEEFASTLRTAKFPFVGGAAASSIEIFHGAHGKLETASPIRTFLPMAIAGEPHIVASYTCTPLVRIPMKELKPKAHVKGVTVAELGNRNRPLDMVEYEKGGKRFILMANSARGVMKVTTDGIGTIDPIQAKVSGETEGLSYDTVDGWDGVTQLDRLNAESAVVLIEKDGQSHLQQRPLP
jgi:hypothetical protein